MKPKIIIFTNQNREIFFKLHYQIKQKNSERKVLYTEISLVKFKKCIDFNQWLKKKNKLTATIHNCFFAIESMFLSSWI